MHRQASLFIFTFSHKQINKQNFILVFFGFH
jgi:hypothetical protein